MASIASLELEYQKWRDLGCDPALVRETFTHSGGAGGQNVNKVATCVQLDYPPENLSVKMQVHRTQAANRIAAWRHLIKSLIQLRAARLQRRIAEREKRRRQNAPRPGWLKAQFCETKRRRAQKRANRVVET